MLSISIRQLEYIIAVAKYGSVTTAADQINISQPALSVAVAKLESHLGKPLFIRRKGSPMVLTTYGREFVKQASTLVGEFETLLQPDRNSFDQRGPVVMGCFEDLGPLIIGKIYTSLYKKFPGINLTIKTGDFDWIADQMITGRIEFAITYDMGMDINADILEIAKLYPHVLVHPNHPLNKINAVSLKAVSTEPLILVNQKHSIWHITRLFRDLQLTPNIVYHASNLEIMRNMVANKLGVGMSYTQSRSTISYDGKKLAYKLLSDDLPPEPVVIASNRSNPMSLFAQEVINEIASLPNLF